MNSFVRHSACQSLMCALLGALLLILPTRLSAQNPSTNRADADRDKCKAGLNRIYEAIQKFREQHKRLPNWLSELSPAFIDDPDLFICPVVRRNGDLQTSRVGLRSEAFWDPIPTSYAYEFSVKEYPLWAGISATMQEYKRGQMSVLGSDVPIIRCTEHKPMLNLSFGGKFYDNVGRDSDWELNFLNVVRIEDLLPAAVFKHLAPVAGKPVGVALRDPRAGINHLDLGRYYHVSLQTPWVWMNPPGEDLASLPQGLVKFDDIEVNFDVRGLIQLKGTKMYPPYPEKVEGIPVGQQCKRVHAILGTVYKEEPGTQVGHLELHYGEGPPANLPIRYGQDVLDWLYSPAERPAAQAQVAWHGVNQAGEKVGGRIRVFYVHFENPRPDTPIKSLSFLSAMSKSAPFLIAITVD